MSIAENLKQLKQDLPEEVTLVAVSKTKPQEDLMEAYAAGQRVFGENKIQEMTAKYEALPKDIAWHMIGHVQSNKVKYMAPYVALIHGVDREKLLKEINKQAAKYGRVIDCLLQNNPTTTYPNVRLVGLMGMATFTEDQEQIKREFATLKSLYERAQQHISTFETLSMGMSGDYPLAIAEGSTMIRVGSKIFGARNY